MNIFEGKKTVIWGCGQNLIKKIDYVKNKLSPVCCVDSDNKLWGKEFFSGYVCNSPACLDEINPDVVIITPENPNTIKVIRGEIEDRDFAIYTLNELWEKNEIELQKRVNFEAGDKRIKHFSCSIGYSACNINCSYCYLNYQNSGRINMEFWHSIDFMVRAVSRARMGGQCFFNICSDGETLLKPRVVDFVRGLLEEGHYVCLITNATVTKVIDELLAFPVDMRKRLLFHCSLHYLELKKKGLVDTYFNNVNRIRESGASVSMSVIGSDDYLPYKDEIKKIAKEKTGVVPYISACRTEGDYNYTEKFRLDSKFSWDEYVENWSGFSGASLEMRAKTLGKITIPCYSGLNSGVINFESGILRSCVPGEYVDDIYEDITRPIKLFKEPHSCKWGFCSHNGMFLSGREMDGCTLPTWNRALSASDDFITDEMREATDYICNY